MSIHRIRRTPEFRFCQECHKEKGTGYWLYWPEADAESYFLCDDCLALARKHEFVRDGKPALEPKT